MDHETFKKHAKEVSGCVKRGLVSMLVETMVQLTAIIAEKEKKSHTYKEGKFESLSEEKTAKIKKFAKEYIHKILRKLDKGKKHKSSHSKQTLTPSASTSTPGQNDIEGIPEDPSFPDISLEDAMDIDEPEDSVGRTSHPKVPRATGRPRKRNEVPPPAPSTDAPSETNKVRFILQYARSSITPPLSISRIE